ncbi:hypothetical protein BZ176_12435 [Listeria monocytogenes]|nr:hypothetical protein [Listeria monocytogenes]EAE9705657.1 hypothetical protein [Listeria monocytogenes]
MIIYATKQTFERYKLKLPSELMPSTRLIAQSVIEKEDGDRLLEWGAKIFYLDKRKCIQVVNFASKFTLFLFDIKVDDIENIGDMIAHYLLELYSDDLEMIKALKKMFEENHVTCIAKLTDKSAIATLNSTQMRYVGNGEYFYEFIQNGVLHSLEINHDVNFKWLFTMKIKGKTQYFYAGEKFREIMLDRYGVS